MLKNPPRELKRIRELNIRFRGAQLFYFGLVAHIVALDL